MGTSIILEEAARKAMSMEFIAQQDANAICEDNGFDPGTIRIGKEPAWQAGNGDCHMGRVFVSFKDRKEFADADELARFGEAMDGVAQRAMALREALWEAACRINGEDYDDEEGEAERQDWDGDYFERWKEADQLAPLCFLWQQPDGAMATPDGDPSSISVSTMYSLPLSPETAERAAEEARGLANCWKACIERWEGKNGQTEDL